MNDVAMQIEAVSVRKQVVRILQAEITSGRFEPGMRLVEKDLCQMMGVSRPSVREALRELEGDGLITSVPNRGPVVAALSRADALAIYQVRAMLEGLAARLFASVASDAQLKQLVGAFKQLEAAYAQGDVEGNLAAKSRFYGVLLEGCGNRIARDILANMNARTTLLRRLSLSSPDRLTESLKEIRAMVTALKRRDGEAAFLATVEHVERATAAAMVALDRTD